MVLPFVLRFALSTHFTGHEIVYTIIFWFTTILMLLVLKYYKCCTKAIHKVLFDRGFIWQKDHKRIKYDGEKWKGLFGIAPLIKHFIHVLFGLLIMISCIVFGYNLASLEYSQDQSRVFELLNEIIINTDQDDLGTSVFSVCFKILIGFGIFTVLSCLTTFLVRWKLTTFYLENYQASVEKLLKIENYLRFILQRDEIFEANIMQFLVHIPLLAENPDLVPMVTSDVQSKSIVMSIDVAGGRQKDHSHSQFNRFCWLLDLEHMTAHEYDNHRDRHITFHLADHTT